MVATIRIGIAKAVLQQELEPSRFEDFCCALLSDVEGGRPVVATSRTWDRGRDGRSVGPGPRVFVCATLDPDLDAKAQADIAKIAKSGAKVEKVYYCTSQQASEYRLDCISAQLATILGQDIAIETISGPQLADLSRLYPLTLWKFYPAEIKDCLKALEEGSNDETRDATILALATACHTNASILRDKAHQLLLLRAIANGQRRTANECSHELTRHLRLGHSFSSVPLEHHLAELGSQNLVSRGDDNRYELTAAGQVALDNEDEAAATELLQGRQVVREYLEDSLETRLYDDQYTKIWNAVQIRLTRFFYEHGHRMVMAIERLLAIKEHSSVDPSDVPELPFFVKDLGDAAAATCAQSALAAEVRQALIDMFEERYGPAYDWLTRVCAAYVLVCMLGLEATSGAKVEDTIAGTHLILDTDVLLELLGSGEPFHDSAVQLVEGWKQIGGTVLIALPVAEEIAYHASIADAEYAEVKKQFLSAESDRRRFVRNVFVRSFGWLVEHGQAGPSQWSKYIRVFQGRDESDPSAVLEYVQLNYRLKRIPEGDLNLQPGKEAWETLRHLAERSGATGRDLKIRRDKAHRDARLFAAMHQYAAGLSAAEGQSACVLVTSSGRLRAVSNSLGSSDELSMSLAEAVYLLTMVPGTSIGLTAMRSVLFDSRILPRTDEFDLLMLRVIRDSGEYNFPWARRAAVTTGVRSRLRKIARDRGDTKLLPETITQGADEDTRSTLGSVIADTLTAVGATPRLEQELQKARARIAELEDELRKRGA